jgi:hypothetical protein
MRTLVSLLICTSILDAVELPKDVYIVEQERFKSSFPYISGDTVRECCDFIFDPTTSFDPSKIRCGDTLFICIDYLHYFFEVYHPQISEPYILVSHHFFDSSDNSVTDGVFDKYLDDEKIIGWFSHNVESVHPKLHPLPIGIGNAAYDYGNKAIFDEIIDLYVSKVEKKYLLYLNFTIQQTRPPERDFVYYYFRNKSFCTAAGRKPLRDYLFDVAHSKFVLSPIGHGLDCWRTWETLLMHSYPVVRSCPLDPLYEDLPVVIVNDWSEVTQELLESKYEEFSNKTFKWEKLYMPYWLEQIRRLKEEYLQRHVRE